MKGFFLMQLICYLVFGILGYLTFYSDPDVTEQTYLALFNSSTSIVFLAQISMLIVCMIAYIFIFKPTKDLIENFVLNKFLTDSKEKELGLQNILTTVFLKVIIVTFIYILMKYEVSFITLVDLISELLIPWIFVLLPVYCYI